MVRRRLLSVVLCAVLFITVFGGTFTITAEEKDPMDNYVLYTIHEKKQFDYIAASKVYGNGWVNGLSIPLSAAPAEHLALSMRFFFEDSEDPENTDLLANAGNVIYFSDTFCGSKRLSWKIKELKAVDGGALVPGEWNEILLPFSTGTGYSAWNFASDTFTFWWMEFSGVTTSTYTVRMSDVCVVDTSRPAVKEEETEWDTTYLVGEIPFTMNKTFTGSGNATATVAAEKKFPAIDASKHNPETLVLLMDITFENLTDPDDFTPPILAGGQIELTSSGGCDINEANFSTTQLRWRSGTYEYALPLSSFGTTGGVLDLSAINYMRIYMNNWQDDFYDKLHITVSNVRLVDTAGAPILPTLFSDGMLFQQNKPMNLWGFGDAGSAVTAELYKGETLLETATATVAEDGRWDAAFAAREGGYDPYTIRITVGDHDWTIRDVLVGELWIACGQSNMELWIGRDMDATAILDAANNTAIRVFCEPLRANGGTSPTPSRDVGAAYWCLGNDKAALSNVSSIAYTFAKELQEELDVPVGIVNAALGATVIEAWLSREAIEQNAALKKALKDHNKYYDADWWPSTAGIMTTWYNAKIAPLEGMNIAGTIWHQGESNSSYSDMYDDAIAVLKDSWGDVFGYPDGDMPLIFAQISPYNYGIGKATIGYLSEYMARGWAVCDAATTAMLPLYDLPLEHMLGSNTSDPLHPRIKTPVGERYALAALNMVYGGHGEYTAPVYKSMEVRDGAVYVTFDRVGEGLRSLDGSAELHGFTVAGADGIYVNAEAAAVDEDTVKVWNRYVAEPQNVMYAFDDFAQAANLGNSVGIPAAPFRTAKPNDTVNAQDKNSTRFTAQDWMYADRDVWVYDEANTENYKYGYRPSFKVSGNTYAYDTNIKAEGTASLRVDFEDDFAVSPILSYPQTAGKWGNFKTLSVSLLNPSATDVSLSLTLTSGGKQYDVPLLDGGSAELLSGGTKFKVYTFALDKLTLNGNAVANPKTVLNGISGATFKGTADGSGTLFFDAFSFGLTAPAVTDAAVNAEAPDAFASFDDLLNAIREAEAIDLTPFTVASAATLELVLQNARAVYGQTPPASLLAVTDALAALRAAMDTLALLPPPTALLGDVNGDDKVDSTDARLTLQYSVKKIAADAIDTTVADVNGDGKADSTDARLILQYAVRKISKFPAEN
ncbi:MAG: hypothetical protein E7549_02580 [Ruminococcaceae bacterium]|nr:hypothetical protein [Oscillospiraceae bacterium]